MGFFDPPPPPPTPEPRERRPWPPWTGPPDNVLGGVVPVQLLLARSERAAVLVSDVVAYGSGLSFELVAVWRRPRDARSLWRRRRDARSLGRRGLVPFEPEWESEGSLSPAFLRFGVELAGGARATNLGTRRRDAGGGSRDVVLVSRGGSGSHRRAKTGYWLWPLPPAGPLAFVCEWPGEEIGLTRREIDGHAVRDAAGRATFVWGDDEERGGGGGISVSADLAFSGPTEEDEE